MLNPLIRKLARGAELSEDDRRTVEEAITDVRQIGPRQDLIREGDRPDEVHLILEGFACRYKTLADGQRQIMAFLVPGDICDLHVAILGAMDHGIGTLSACRVAFIPQTTVAVLTENHPAIVRALWWNTLVDRASCASGSSAWAGARPTSRWRTCSASSWSASNRSASRRTTASSSR